MLKGNNNKNDHKSGKYKKLLFSRRVGFMEMLASLFYSESCLCHCVLLIWVSENSFRSDSICAVSLTWRNVCVNKPQQTKGINFLLFPLFHIRFLITSGVFLISATCSSSTGSTGKCQGPPSQCSCLQTLQLKLLHTCFRCVTSWTAWYGDCLGNSKIAAYPASPFPEEPCIQNSFTYSLQISALLSNLKRYSLCLPPPC